MNISFNEFEECSSINPSFNDYVTEFCHGHSIRITKSQRKFLKTAYDINVIERRLWYNADFRPMRGDNYRQNLKRLSPFIEKIINSRPCFYKLRGIHMPYYVTKKPRGVYPKEIDPEFDRIIAELKHQPPMMHDIRVGTRIAKLHENLLESGLNFDPHNHGFTVYIPTDARFDVRANVYRESMQVIIGCTYEALPYDLNGFHELSALLGYACYHLEVLSHSEFYHQPIPEWKVQYLHLNQDGKEINGKRFSYSISDLSNHSVFYLKKFKDGTLKNRFETHEKPNKTIEEITKSMT